MKRAKKKEAGKKVNWRAHLTTEETEFVKRAQAAAEEIARAQKAFSSNFAPRYMQIRRAAVRRAHAAARASA